MREIHPDRRNVRSRATSSSSSLSNESDDIATFLPIGIEWTAFHFTRTATRLLQRASRIAVTHLHHSVMLHSRSIDKGNFLKTSILARHYESSRCRCYYHYFRLKFICPTPTFILLTFLHFKILEIFPHNKRLFVIVTRREIREIVFLISHSGLII
jgi:hypothetical protein